MSDTSAAPRPIISVIIVSYNTRAMTLDCLRALYDDLRASGLEDKAEVLVVDNASRDNSVEAIREAFPRVKLIENRENTGFGAANNQAMRQAQGDFFLLLNSDAFPLPGAIHALHEYSCGHPEAAVVGPRLQNADGSLQRSCFRFPSPSRAWLENLWISSLLSRVPALDDYGAWTHDDEREVDFLVGACMMVRREAYAQVGGFDEDFFMYSEETDWQRRMKDAGWKIVFVPNACVTHLGGASGANEKARVNNHFFQSLDRYERKHHGLRGLVSLRLAMVVGCFLRLGLWSAMLVMPRRREVARSKTRLHSWLLLRQLTNWRF